MKVSKYRIQQHGPDEWVIEHGDYDGAWELHRSFPTQKKANEGMFDMLMTACKIRERQKELENRHRALRMDAAELRALLLLNGTDDALDALSEELERSQSLIEAMRR